MDRVTAEWVDERAAELSYPVTRADAAAALAEARLEADGEEHNVGRLVSRTGSDAFHGPDEVADALNAVLDGGASDGHPC